MSEQQKNYAAQTLAGAPPMMTARLARDLDESQMRAALEEIQERAATMPNGGSWAAGLAALCLGTLRLDGSGNFRT